MADQQRGLIYLSIRSDAPTDANNVIALNPNSGTVTRRVVVGSNPGRLALSDNGQFIYVGIIGANAVRRVDPVQFVAGPQWFLPANQFAREIEVLPGRPGSVAVSRHSTLFSPSLVGVTIYDDGIARSESSPGHTGGSRIAFLSSPDTLYGVNDLSTTPEFFTIGIDGEGARHLFGNDGLINGSSLTQITGAAGRIYATDGSIIDAGRREKVGSFGDYSTRGSFEAMVVDHALGRAFILNETRIAVYDLNTYLLLGTVPLPPAILALQDAIEPGMARWGTDGIAFLKQDELVLVRSPLFAP